MRTLQLMVFALIADRRQPRSPDTSHGGESTAPPIEIDGAANDNGGRDTLGERRPMILRRTAIAVWAAVIVFRTWTTGFAFNRELLLVYICTGLVAASIGRRRMLQVMVDWLPFGLILVIYDLSRGAATLIGMPTLWQIQPKIDRWLFFGTEPTGWLQEHFKLAQPPWWEVVISTIYMSFFIMPYAVAGVLWLRNRDDWKAFTRRFLALSFIALACYAIVPAAPPWAAARCTLAEVATGPSEPACMFRWPAAVPDGGLLGPTHASRPGAADFVERISTRGWGEFHLGIARALLDEGQASVNLVAAIPSLHAAVTAMIAAFLWRRIKSRWRPLLLAYVLVMAFTLVYSAEHYVFDILLGWALAMVVHAGMSRVEARGSSPSSGPPASPDESRPAELEPV